jgi:hypothetical protein
MLLNSTAPSTRTRPSVFNGAWRNGKRSGLLIRFLTRSVGSSPTAPTHHRAHRLTVGTADVAQTRPAAQAANERGLRRCFPPTWF